MGQVDWRLRQRRLTWPNHLLAPRHGWCCTLHSITRCYCRIQPLELTRTLDDGKVLSSPSSPQIPASIVKAGSSCQTARTGIPQTGDTKRRAIRPIDKQRDPRNSPLPIPECLPQVQSLIPHLLSSFYQLLYLRFLIHHHRLGRRFLILRTVIVSGPVGCAYSSFSTRLLDWRHMTPSVLSES